METTLSHSKRTADMELASPESMRRISSDSIQFKSPVNLSRHRSTASLPKVVRSMEEEEKMKEMLNGGVTTLPFSLNALQVMSKRYLLRNVDGKVTETPEEMFQRVAVALAEAERAYNATDADVVGYAQEFYDVMTNMEFIPAGRTLANAGGPTRVVANCIVLHVDDSMESIFSTLYDAALLQKDGSGLGFPLHLMRPAGSITKASLGSSSGPVSFLHVYNTAFGVIKQQNRHGANMAVMSVSHPDILEFIHCKEIEGCIKNFNISVGLTDKFMKAVSEDDKSLWMCEFEGSLYKPRRIVRDMNYNILEIIEMDMTARELFEEIVECAWNNGEPGCVFLDTVNATNPLPGLGRIEACNPCGEQFLHDGDVCNLGSINLEKFVSEKEVNFKHLREVVRVAVRMLDNVVDVSDFRAGKVRDTARDNRRVGLSIMGFADMLYQLRVPYNSAQGVQVAEQVMQCISDAAHEMSAELAEAKGVFKNYDKSVYAQRGVKRRNAALTNIAPTGSISMLYDVSGGVEPYFALAYHYRGILGGDVNLRYVNKHLKDMLEECGCYRDDILDRVIQEGTVQNIAEIPEEYRKVFVTSMDITADEHIQMQAAFQKHCDNAISKTINFPHSASRTEVLSGFVNAWKSGCKGCTVYRDGSRQLQVLNLNKDDNKESTSVDEECNDDATQTEAMEESPLRNSESPSEQVVVVASDQFRPVVRKREHKMKEFCPECNSKTRISEGCWMCLSCGLSACSM